MPLLRPKTEHHIGFIHAENGGPDQLKIWTHAQQTAAINDQFSEFCSPNDENLFPCLLIEGKSELTEGHFTKLSHS
ncbi:hypothetical protein N7495_007899 [Penicillium taxi]|uniref:uncharacterized protein n=1 Tax=Penicillium taxi TaxID=168475 RepID=UPI00254548F2|nr:uncharacterized protein N7495_007899 [Penicillium taxi]KAJ5887858.1 hypothetical protein N7495_007899 [Penicillium taxi]